MGIHVGDRIMVESERAGQTARAGTVEQVLSDDPKRLRVRWDDGHTTVVVPAAGAAHIEPAAAPPKRRAKGAT